MKDEKERAFFQKLNNLDDADVEKISVDIPALDKQTKKRIFDKCMSRMSETDFESENTVSGTDKYSKPHIIRYISTAAACLVAVAGITGMILFNKNIGTPPDDISATPQYTSIPVQSGTAVLSAESTTSDTCTTTTFTTTAEITETTVTEAVTVQMTETEQITENVTETITEIVITEQITETATEVTTTETTDNTTENTFEGFYGTQEQIDYNSGDTIIITQNSDNFYNIYIGFFRVIGFEITGSINDDGILIFTTQNEPEIYGKLIFAGEIRLNDEGCILTITESENNPIKIDNNSERQYYRIS